MGYNEIMLLLRGLRLTHDKRLIALFAGNLQGLLCTACVDERNQAAYVNDDKGFGSFHKTVLFY